MEDLIKEFEFEMEAKKRSQHAYKKINETKMDNYLEKLLSDGNPYTKKLLEMSLNALEKEYIKKSEEVAKLPEPPTEVREKTVKKGFIREIQTVRIRKESYLKTQLYLIGAMLRKRKREIKQGLRKNQEKKILQHMTVKKEIEKLKQKRGNKNKSKTELFHNLAEKTGKSFDAIKRAFYYKSK